MKLSNLLHGIFIAMLVICVISLWGCATTGIERSEKATTTMQTMDSDIKLVVVQLDATASSLSELTKPGQTDIRKAFDLYTDNVKKIEKLQKNFANHADEMKDRGKEYFEEWQKEGNKYKNSQIQGLSEQRRIELSDIYGRIAENSVGVKSSFESYMSDVKEIQLYLSNDLTAKGIGSISTITQKVVNDGDNLKYAIKNVQTAIDRARAEMAQGGN